jgi:predicted Zn-dependent protease
MQGDQAEKGLQQSPLIVRDEALNAYVKKLVCDLAGPQCGSVRVYIVDYPAFNAACYPNGMMTVYSGLLLRAENEAQLSFVLGHEMTHFLRRHTLSQHETVRNTSTAMAVLSLGAAGVGVGVGVNLSSMMSVAQLVAMGALYSYSRDQEREADGGGFEIAVGRGYDPRQGALIWNHMEEEENANPRRDKPLPFYASHPTNKERLTTMTKRAEEMEIQTHADDLGTDSYRAAIMPLRAGWLEQEINRGSFDESLVLIRRLIRNDAEAAELQYYLGETYRRRNAKGDMETAMAAYRAAIAGTGAPIAVHRGLGLVALKAGQKTVARDAFRQYLALTPAASDRATIEYYLQTLGD